MKFVGNSYHSDAPLDRPENDELRRWPFAKRIAESIKSRKDSSCLVMGIYGAWGSGKTSVLRLIRHALADDPKIVPVWFNPWRYHDEDQLIRALIGTVGAKLQQTEGSWFERVRRRFGRLLKGADGVSASIAGGLASVEVGDLLKRLGSALDPDTLETVKERFGELLRTQERRVVVFLDDMDRLERADIQAVFRMVKLTVDFQNTVYVLAFDPDWVAGALCDRFGSAMPTRDSGRTFLEKIIQVPLQIPRPDRPRLVRFFSDAVTSALHASGIELADKQVQTYSMHFYAAFSPRLSVPRQAIRHHNALLFSLPLLKGEVNVVDLLLLEGLREFHAGVYELIWHHPDLFVWNPASLRRDNPKATTQATKLIEDALQGLPPVEAEAVQDLLTYLFPTRLRADRNAAPSDQLAEQLVREKRAGSIRHFDRYFLYSVAEGDVSDQEMDAFLADLAARSANDIVVEIRQMVGKDRAEVFVEKLQARRGELAAAVARRLGEGIAKAGDVFEDPSEGAEFFSPRSQAAHLVKLLVAGLPPEDRYAMAHVIATEAQPLPFACECYLRIVPEDRSQERNPLLRADEDRDLGAALLARIRAAAKAGGLLHDFGRETSRLLYLWSILSTPDEPKKFVTELVNGAPGLAVEILRCFLPRWTSDDIYNFEAQGYASLVKVVDPDVIAGALEKALGTKIRLPPLASKHGPPEPEHLARQFMALHQRPRGAKGTDAASGEVAG